MASRKTTRRSKSPNAITLLTNDHKNVDGLFKKFERQKNDSKKAEIAAQICAELTVHATIEEEIFYPACREAVKGGADLLDEAKVEHASAKDLIAQLQSMSVGDELYDAKVKVLGEYVRHHVKEEQRELFPKARKSKMDLAAIGERLAARKAELMSEMHMEESPARRRAA